MVRGFHPRYSECSRVANPHLVQWWKRRRGPALADYRLLDPVRDLIIGLDMEHLSLRCKTSLMKRES